MKIERFYVIQIRLNGEWCDHSEYRITTKKERSEDRLRRKVWNRMQRIKAQYLELNATYRLIKREVVEQNVRWSDTHSTPIIERMKLKL